MSGFNNKETFALLSAFGIYPCIHMCLCLCTKLFRLFRPVQRVSLFSAPFFCEFSLFSSLSFSLLLSLGRRRDVALFHCKGQRERMVRGESGEIEH